MSTERIFKKFQAYILEWHWSGTRFQIKNQRSSTEYKNKENFINWEPFEV